MPGRSSCCVEQFCLGQLSNLDQLEEPWLDLMATGEPECVATALRLFHSHLAMTLKHLGPAMLVSEVEAIQQPDPSATASSI